MFLIFRGASPLLSNFIGGHVPPHPCFRRLCRASRTWEAEVTAETEFKRDVFYKIIDSVISGLTTRFKAIEELDKTFGFLWKYRDIADNVQIIAACRRFASRYRNDVSEDRLAEEVMHLKVIHDTNFGAKSLASFDLLNEIARFKLEEIFGNVCIALRIFCSIPATVASVERSFSKLSPFTFHLGSVILCWM